MALQMLLMCSYVTFLLVRETEFMREQAKARVAVIIKAIASNSRIWMLSRDIAGMDMLISSFNDFPYISEVMLLDTQGRILAHTKIEKIGERLPEEELRAFVNRRPDIILFRDDRDHLDMFAPVMEEDMLLGWVRFVMNQTERNIRFWSVIQRALWFMLMVFMLSGILSWWLAARLTRDISHLTQTTRKIRDGEYEERPSLDREDEIGDLAQNFNQMLDVLNEHERALTRQAAALARSNAELERFAYVASHDLQEPLRMVTSYVQLLARRYKGRLDEDADVFIGYAVDGVGRMQQLINDLLAYSRVDSKGGDFLPTDLNEALESSLFSLRVSLTECGANIQRDPLPILKVDNVQIRQLWQNLLGNALKFRGENTPVIRIYAQEEEEEWRFFVSDNGIGVESGQEERIFQIFQRLHGRDKYPGTGIGLSICKRIVERHGGKIGVRANGNGAPGAEFWFTLPKNRDDEGIVMARQEARLSSSDASSLSSGSK
ncbi:MAG: HAMP domain-containing protein [Zoogloeaceae bacterium]|nr:HAMP domain-containing protein [Zoogloeaceae bacterium]